VLLLLLQLLWQDAAKAAYDKFAAAMGLTEGSTNSLSDAMTEQKRVIAAIKSETETLTRTYEEMGRSASKSVREVGDKLTDLMIVLIEN
jgi:phage-related tail protein